MPEGMLGWNEPKKICIHEICSQESFLVCRHVDLQFFQKWTLSQMLFYENWEVLQNINFTE